MSPTVAFASPKIAREMTKLLGDRVETMTISMRPCKDVPRFIQKVKNAHKGTAKSKLVFK
jgi:hypothetical protein